MRRRRAGRCGGGRESGYTLVGLIIAIAIVNIALASVVTSWRIADQRAREAEYLWRGQQILRAMSCYEGGDAGEALTRLAQLVEANCLRRVFDDPLTGGEWRIFRQEDLTNGVLQEILGTGQEGAGEADPASGVGPGGSSAGSGFGSGTGSSMGSRIGAAIGVGGGGEPRLGGTAPGSGPGPQAGGLFSGRQPGALPGARGESAIIGVGTTRTGPSLRLWGGRQEYERWVFLGAGAPGAEAAGQPGLAAPGPSAPGLPGLGRSVPNPRN